MTEIVNVKVKYIRPQYENLQQWMEDENNVYIGRKGVVFILNTDTGNKERFPKKDSIWANPFSVKKYGREGCLEKYKDYIEHKIRTEPTIYDLNLLKNKKLGCWCKPEKCHGDILIELMRD